MQNIKMLASVVFSMAVATPAFGQTAHLVTTPSMGSENIVPAGGELFREALLLEFEAYKLDQEVVAGKKIIPAGTSLIPTQTSSKFKVCGPVSYAQANSSGYVTFVREGREPCFFDDDIDGKFDRYAKDFFAAAKKLASPAPYSPQPITELRSGSFRRAFLYQGATSDSLRFSYREFTDDLARPAFTEELTIPREPFPQMLMLKNLQIEVLAVSGMGLKYRIVATRTP